jgi:hypothetical protein
MCNKKWRKKLHGRTGSKKSDGDGNMATPKMIAPLCQSHAGALRLPQGFESAFEKICVFLSFWRLFGFFFAVLDFSTRTRAVFEHQNEFYKKRSPLGQPLDPGLDVLSILGQNS